MYMSALGCYFKSSVRLAMFGPMRVWPPCARLSLARSR
jgi:hypothetical protein